MRVEWFVSLGIYTYGDIYIYIAPIMNSLGQTFHAGAILVAAEFLDELPCPESKWDFQHVSEEDVFLERVRECEIP